MTGQLQAGGAAGTLATTVADFVLTGGSVLTMDGARRSASAVAIGGGRILAVGRDDEILELRGPATRRIDLRGRTVLPGFQDAHIHASMGGLALLRCPLHELPRRLDAYLNAIAEYARANPDRPWVLGDGWYMEAFPGGTPSRADLDRVVPDRPAFFLNRDMHGAWVNSRALERARIDGGTPDPPHGRIERDETGEPSGTLHEGAVELVRSLIPAPTRDERADGIEFAQAYLHRLGITAWQDAWVTPAELEAYQLVVHRGRLTARVVACLWWERERGGEQIEEFVEQREGARVGRLAPTTVKIMQDGVAENYTAAMLEPYLDGHGHPTGKRGLSFVEPELLKRHVTRLDALGFQVHFHTLGDRAVREALDAVEAARDANGPRDNRHHLAHLQLVDPADVPRFRELDATANIQPYWACTEPQMTELTLPFLPPERAVLQYPFRRLLDAGVRLAGGSDWTVSTPHVLAEIEVAVNRVNPEDRAAPPFLADQALSLEDALVAFTTGTAYVNHLDDMTGTLEPGKLADLVVLDRDVMAADPHRLAATRILLTLVEGDIVHEDPELEA